MHSSALRGSDFEIELAGVSTSHDAFFGDVRKTTRLGVVAPDRFEGTGAALLVMAYVTAFYDCYRAEGDDFFAYPDFFVFQGQTPMASYGMLDAWPDHKMVYVAPGEMATAVTDRAIDVLLLPERTWAMTETSHNRVTLESARRTMTRCFVYDALGSAAEPNLTITCAMDPVSDWVLKVFESVDDSVAAATRDAWLAHVDGMDTITQSYREIEIQEALDILVPQTIGGKG